MCLHPPPVAVVTHTPLHPHFLHHLAAIPIILSLWVSQVQVSQVSAPSHIQPIQCFPLPCWGPGNLPGSADVSISATFLLSPSLDFHSLGHVGAGEMVRRWESSDITDLHGSVVAYSWSRRTDLKFLLTSKYFPCGIPLWFSRFHKLGIPNLIVSFLIRGNVLEPQLPTCSILHSLSISLTSKHHLEKIKHPQSAAY